MVIQRILRIAAIVLGLLFIPFISMILSSDMNWSLADFVIAGIILFGAGTMYEGIHTIIKSRHIRIIAGVGIIVGVSIIWVELAVGIFGTPFAGS